MQYIARADSARKKFLPSTLVPKGTTDRGAAGHYSRIISEIGTGNSVKEFSSYAGGRRKWWFSTVDRCAPLTRSVDLRNEAARERVLLSPRANYGRRGSALLYLALPKTTSTDQRRLDSAERVVAVTAEVLDDAVIASLDAGIEREPVDRWPLLEGASL